MKRLLPLIFILSPCFVWADSRLINYYFLLRTTNTWDAPQTWGSSSNTIRGLLDAISSVTVRGIYVSTSGFQVAGSTIQGVFLLEGGTIQFRNGANEFSIAFASSLVAGEKLIVANVTGNRALIASGIDATGGSGSGDFNSLQNPATGFFNMNTFGIGFASQVAGGQLLFDGSSTVRGINISSTGYMVGASTVQGVFLVEGGTFQFRNGTNEFSITFATPLVTGEKLIVANVIGNRALIASGVDATGSGASPITTSDWNIMNTTGMSRVDELQADISTHSTRVDELQTDLSTHSTRMDELQVHVSTAQVLIFDLSNATANIKNTTFTWTAEQNFSSASFGGLVVLTTSVHILGNVSSTGTFFAKGATFTTIVIDQGGVITTDPSLTFGSLSSKSGIGLGVDGLTFYISDVVKADFAGGSSNLNTMRQRTIFPSGDQVAPSISFQVTSPDDSGIFAEAQGTSFIAFGLAAAGRESMRVKVGGNDSLAGTIAFGRKEPESSVFISTIGSNLPILRVSSASVIFEVNGSSVFIPSMIVVDGSATIKGIVVSSAGFQVAASTIQGVFMLEGGTIQFRNGENEFSINFATGLTAGNKLIVANAVGNRYTIASGIDATGGGGGGGGGGNGLSVSTGSFESSEKYVSSPTAVISFSSASFNLRAPGGGATAYIEVGTNTAKDFTRSAILSFSTANGTAIWDTPRPTQLFWSGASLMAISTGNSGNIAPVVLTTGTIADDLSAMYPSSACRGVKFMIPTYADSFSTPTFTALWFTTNPVSGNVVWNMKYSTGISNGNSWNVRMTTVVASASANADSRYKVTHTIWSPSGVRGINGRGTLSAMGWEPDTLVMCLVCREQNSPSDGDTLRGPLPFLSGFRISVPMR